MRDLDKALADILTIRNQLAAGTAFQGYGPGAVAATGVVALGGAIVQAWSLGGAAPGPGAYFAFWIAVAAISVAILAVEAVARTKRAHSGLADEMLRHAFEQMLPPAGVGALLLVAFWQFAPDALWMLPGLWLILVGLGAFASLRILPPSMALGGAYYILAGFIVLALTAETRSLSPWAMGLPFAIGEFLVAAILHSASERRDVES
jgi:hypothetical protein